MSAPEYISEYSDYSDISAPGWEASARCRTEAVPTGLFFSEDLGDIATAKRICGDCPVLAPCLEGAIERARTVRRLGRSALLETGRCSPSSAAGDARPRSPVPRISYR